MKDEINQVKVEVYKILKNINFSPNIEPVVKTEIKEIKIPKYEEVKVNLLYQKPFIWLNSIILILFLISFGSMIFFINQNYKLKQEIENKRYRERYDFTVWMQNNKPKVWDNYISQWAKKRN